MADKQVNKPSFFEGLKAEYKKITWPDISTLAKQSVAVICTSVVVGLIIAAVDYLVKYGVNFITNLR